MSEIMKIINAEKGKKNKTGELYCLIHNILTNRRIKTDNVKLNLLSASVVLI